jgi:DNA-directed RNA polymerase specialized sigma24 family protein
MARIEWVKPRLENWARWKGRGSSGRLGYARSSVLVGEPTDGYREAPLPVDDVDASVTNTAVESLRAGRSHLYMTLQLIYVAGVGVRETARRMARAESTIKANLDQADHALSQWFGERSEKNKKSLST